MTGRAIVAAALLAAEYAGVGGEADRPVDPASVGQPSDAALIAVERLEEEEATPSPHAQPLDESSTQRDTAPG
jgi:hypothetical protein